MPKKTFTPEQIVGKLRQIEVLVSQGKTVPLAAKEAESPIRRTIGGARKSAVMKGRPQRMPPSSSSPIVHRIATLPGVLLPRSDR